MNEKILGKKQLVFLIQDEDGEKFGAYLNQTIKSLIVFCNSAGLNVFNTDVDDAKIDYTPSYFNSAFSQNPFY